MSNRFTLHQAVKRADLLILDGYKVDSVAMELVEGKTLITYGMEEFGQPNRVFDGAQVIDLVHGEADIVDVEGTSLRAKFFETVVLADNTEPLPG